MSLYESRPPAPGSPLNPRLSVDLGSGKAQRRRLFESIERLGFESSAAGSPLRGPTSRTPAAYDTPFQGASPMFERAIGLMHGRHTQEMHERHVGALRPRLRLGTARTAQG